jgi:hypothetical protein
MVTLDATQMDSEQTVERAPLPHLRGRPFELPPSWGKNENSRFHHRPQCHPPDPRRPRKQGMPKSSTPLDSTSAKKPAPHSNSRPLPPRRPLPDPSPRFRAPFQIDPYPSDVDVSRGWASSGNSVSFRRPARLAFPISRLRPQVYQELRELQRILYFQQKEQAAAT